MNGKLRIVIDTALEACANTNNLQAHISHLGALVEGVNESYQRLSDQIIDQDDIRCSMNEFYTKVMSAIENIKKLSDGQEDPLESLDQETQNTLFDSIMYLKFFSCFDEDVLRQVDEVFDLFPDLISKHQMDRIVRQEYPYDWESIPDTSSMMRIVRFVWEVLEENIWDPKAPKLLPPFDPDEYRQG